MGISSIVVGLTVVAFGTSAPELAVSIGASLSGQANVALGNVVGSNIFNVLFILGAAAVITPLTAASRLVRLDVPLGIGVSGITLLLALDGAIGRVDGGLLVSGLVLYTGALIVQSRTQPEPPHGPSDSGDVSDTSWAWNLGLVVGGLALLVLGARWFVAAAVSMARLLGISELVIGLTIVAGGTSLPELATSVLAGLRGERDIAIGNVVGSGLFNLLGVLGLSAAVATGGIPVSEPVLWFDLPVMVAVAGACLPIFFTGYTIARWEGLLFLGYYGAYTTYLVLGATQHEALSAFSLAMGAFVVPLTVVTLVVSGLRSWRGARSEPTG
jgi:cation:H+ antiporter